MVGSEAGPPGERSRGISCRTSKKCAAFAANALLTTSRVACTLAHTAIGVVITHVNALPVTARQFGTDISTRAAVVLVARNINALIGAQGLLADVCASSAAVVPFPFRALLPLAPPPTPFGSNLRTRVLGDPSECGQAGNASYQMTARVRLLSNLTVQHFNRQFSQRTYSCEQVASGHLRLSPLGVFPRGFIQAAFM